MNQDFLLRGEMYKFKGMKSEKKGNIRSVEKQNNLVMKQVTY